MEGQGTDTLYQAQKQKKPTVEDVIREVLEGEQREAALAFTAYLRENGMSPTWGSVHSWKASYKGKGVCYIKLDRLGRNRWWVNPLTDYSDAYLAFVERENLRDTIWRNLAHCTRCHPNSCAPKGEGDRFSGVSKTFFGREFEHICRGGDTSFINPDAEAIACLKRMIDFKREAIQASAVPKVKYVSPKRRVSRTEVIHLEREIKVVGLSLARAGWPGQMEKAGDLWGLYTDEHRRGTKAKDPVVEYGISVLDPDARDYIVGSEVEDFGEIPPEMVAITIPAGKYIRDTFGAFDFEDLVGDALGKREPILLQWAQDNDVKIKNPALFIEVYPVQEMARPGGGTGSGDFQRAERLKVKYPQMYTLLPID